MTSPWSPRRWGPASPQFYPMVALCRHLPTSPGPKEEWGGPETHPDQAWPVTARSGNPCRLRGTENPRHCAPSQPLLSSKGPVSLSVIGEGA